MEAGLYVVGTPIGNLGDISSRAVAALGEADLIIAEDTRQTRKLLAHFELHTEMMSCHRFNETARLEGIIDRIQNGQAVVQVSDGGMPTISDPGARMVVACREAELMVTSIPGPTAVTTAVALSGYGEHGFVFIGFPPRKPGKIRKLLRQWLEVELPVVLYESPYRVFKLIGFVEEVFGPQQEIFFVRELTKKFEEMHTGTAAELRAAYEGREVKGECVLVIAPTRFIDDRH